MSVSGNSSGGNGKGSSKRRPPAGWRTLTSADPAAEPGESEQSAGLTIDDIAPRKYDENLFLIGGKSTGPGDMERVTFKVHESYVAMARRLVESKRWPVLGKSDIARAGFIAILRWMDQMEPDALERSIYHRIAQMEEVVAWEMRQIRYVKFIDQMQEMVAEQLALPNGRVQVARVLRRLRRHVNRMEDSFYKNHFAKLFNDRFGAYELAGVGLLDSSDGGEELEGLEGIEPPESSEAGAFMLAMERIFGEEE